MCKQICVVQTCVVEGSSMYDCNSASFTLSKQSSDDEDCSAKGRNRHIIVNKAELANSIEVLDSFKLARESWELLYSLEFLDKGKNMPVILVLFNLLSVLPVCII